MEAAYPDLTHSYYCCEEEFRKSFVMTTEIKPSSGRSDKFNGSRKAELLNKIEGIPDDINAAIFIENEGIITVADDK